MSIPRLEWFLRQPPSRLHGRGHIARVMVWAAVLTRGTEWFDTVVWAAACHDLRREDDGADPDHGFRAGAWVREHLAGQLAQPPAEIELIASACDWHVCADRRAKWDHPTLWLLKDADGLDRVRLYDLNPRMLRHAQTHQWIAQAQRLYELTDTVQDPAVIWRVAAQLGLPVEELRAWAEQHSVDVSRSQHEKRET